MQKVTALFSILLLACTSIVRADDDTFIDYQNYNHGYCSTCSNAPCGCGEPCSDEGCPPVVNPCDPCAPVCGTECGISVCAIAVAIAAVAAAAAIVISSGDGGSSTHIHN